MRRLAHLKTTPGITGSKPCAAARETTPLFQLVFYPAALRAVSNTAQES